MSIPRGGWASAGALHQAGGRGIPYLMCSRGRFRFRHYLLPFAIPTKPAISLIWNAKINCTAAERLCASMEGAVPNKHFYVAFHLIMERLTWC